jgi:hypothetical protein
LIEMPPILTDKEIDVIEQVPTMAEGKKNDD